MSFLSARCLVVCVCVCAYVEFCLTWLTHSNNWCRLCTLVGFWTYWRRRWIQRWRNPTCEFKYLQYALVLLLMHPHSFYISIYRKCVSFSLTYTLSRLRVCVCLFMNALCQSKEHKRHTFLYVLHTVVVHILLKLINIHIQFECWLLTRAKCKQITRVLPISFYCNLIPISFFFRLTQWNWTMLEELSEEEHIATPNSYHASLHFSEFR